MRIQPRFQGFLPCFSPDKLKNQNDPKIRIHPTNLRKLTSILTLGCISNFIVELKILCPIDLLYPTILLYLLPNNHSSIYSYTHIRV